MQVIEQAGRYSPARDREPNHWIEHLVSEFTKVGGDLALLVIFAPPEGSRQRAESPG